MMDGDRQSLDSLLPIVYQELRRLAASYLRRERPGQGLGLEVWKETVIGKDSLGKILRGGGGGRSAITVLSVPTGEGDGRVKAEDAGSLHFGGLVTGFGLGEMPFERKHGPAFQVDVRGPSIPGNVFF